MSIMNQNANFYQRAIDKISNLKTEDFDVWFLLINSICDDARKSDNISVRELRELLIRINL